MTRNPPLLVVFGGVPFVLFPIPVITLFWMDQIGMSLTDVMVLQAIFGLGRGGVRVPVRLPRRPRRLPDVAAHRRRARGRGMGALRAGATTFAGVAARRDGPRRRRRVHLGRGRRLAVRRRWRRAGPGATSTRAGRAACAPAGQAAEALEQRGRRLALRGGAAAAVLAPGAERAARPRRPSRPARPSRAASPRGLPRRARAAASCASRCASTRGCARPWR